MAYGDKPLETLPNGQVIWARNEKNEPICNGLLRNKDGKRCKTPRGLGLNGRCRLHNGQAATGVEAPNYKHGQYMPTSRYGEAFKDSKLREQYEALLGREDYLSLKEDIVVTQMRVRMKMGELTNLDTEPLRILSQKADTAEELLAGDWDEEELEAQVQELIDYIREIEKAVDAGAALEKTQEHLRKLTDTEGKLRQGEQEQMSAVRVVALFRLLQESLRMHMWGFLIWLKKAHPEVFKDPEYFNPLELIQKDVARLQPANPGVDAEAVTIEG